MNNNKNNMKRKEHLISTLVKKFDDYMTNLSEKRKITNIFFEFEDRARNDLMKLV